MICMHRPIIILEGQEALDREFREARITHHKLLAIEDEHQALLDKTSEEIAPGILRVGRILKRQTRGKRRARRVSEGKWAPRARPELEAKLKEMKAAMVKKRNADPRWKAACKWLDMPDESGAMRAKARKSKKETEEAFEARKIKRTESGRDFKNRREARRAVLYEALSIHYSNWNFLLGKVEQAREAVLGARSMGMPAEWHHPKWDASNTLQSNFLKEFRVVERGPLWWTLEVKVFESKIVRFKAKFGNWHDMPETAVLRTCQITRRKRGRGWKYSASVSVKGMPDRAEKYATRGDVVLDWGHREHGHAGAKEGMRVFTWLGDDGKKGEILLPAKCRALLDKKDALKSRVDLAYNARKQPEKNRHVYRRRLLQSGVRTEEETLWLKWERRYDARIEATEKKVQNVREEAYYQAVRMLRRQYKNFGVEDESNASIKDQQTEEMMPRRMRQNRDLSARYEFISMIERYGGTKVPVSARNTTRECPECGHLSKNGPELLIACEGCGAVRDKDYGACKIILKRMKAALATAAE